MLVDFVGCHLLPVTHQFLFTKTRSFSEVRRNRERIHGDVKAHWDMKALFSPFAETNENEVYALWTHQRLCPE